MTNEELLTDLKQFIEATVSQQMAHVAAKEDINQIDRKIDAVRDELKSDIKLLGEKFDVVHDAVAETVQDHEQRLSRLEQRTA